MIVFTQRFSLNRAKAVQLILIIALFFCDLKKCLPVSYAVIDPANLVPIVLLVQ